MPRSRPTSATAQRLVATGVTTAFLDDERTLREFVVGDLVKTTIDAKGGQAALYLFNDSYDPLNYRQLRVAVNKDETLPKRFEKYCGRPISEVPDPFECHEHYSRHCENALLDRLNSFGVIIIASSLYAGSRVILRPSLQCAATGALLAKLVMQAAPPASCVQIVNRLASEFLDACYASSSVDLIHYVGSNQHALSVFTRSFSAGKTCLVDGQGNGLLYLDETVRVDEAVRIITSGATRFNGQTCTSINGVLVCETVYEAVKAALAESFARLRLGHPLDPEAQVGPLFRAKQSERLQATIRESPHARVLCGGDVQGAYFKPAILEGVDPHDPIATEGFSGPEVWFKPVREGGQWEWFRRNRFPLSDTIFSRRVERIRALTTHSWAARICVNEDPSVESMFEPWGGYPPSGVNPVSRWIDKYRQTLQLDGQFQQIMAIKTDVECTAA